MGGRTTIERKGDFDLCRRKHESKHAVRCRAAHLDGLAAAQSLGDREARRREMEEADVEVSWQIWRALLLPGGIVRSGVAAARLPVWRDRREPRWRRSV